MGKMTRLMSMVCGLTLALSLSVAAADTTNPPATPAPPPPTGPAQPPGGPTTPPSGPAEPPPPVKSAPALYIGQHGHALSGVMSEYPFDFQFEDQIYGIGFQPGESVHVSAHGISVPAQKATADQYGSFVITMSFSWTFCGPDASTQPPPNFDAVGDHGTTASATATAPPCPYLVASPPIVATSEPGDGQNPTGIASSPGAVSGGTGSTGSGTAQPGTPVPPVPSVPPPVIVPQPVPTTLDVEGFGFHAGEAVSVQVTGADGKPQGSPVHLSADAQGRIQTQVQARMPAPCGSDGVPSITASGDKGTSITTRPIWIMPLIACPVKVQTPGTGDPSSTPPPDSSPAPVPPTPSNPGSSTAIDIAQTPPLSISLRSASVRRGHTARATISADAAGALSFRIQYHGGKIQQKTFQVGSASAVALSWRVPKIAKTGKATITVTSASKAVIQTSFTVK